MTDTSRVPQVHRVILVRHAQSSPQPERPSNEWWLTDAGHAAARRLAALALFEHAAGFYAGPEPKMVATLTPVAAEHGPTVIQDAAFAESHSEGFFGQDEFLAIIRRYFEAPDRPPAPRWEPADQVAARFEAGIQRLCTVHQPILHPGHATPGTFAVCSGGRAITAYLARTLGYTPVQALESWNRLAMPDVAVLELSAGVAARLVIPFGALRV